MYNLDRNPLSEYPVHLKVEEIVDAHLVITSFNEYIEYPIGRRYLKKWFMAVHKKDHWRMRSPEALLYFYERIEMLLEAGKLLAEMPVSKRMSTVVIIEDKPIDLMLPTLYFPSSGFSDAWEYFPRHLTRKEFLNPYLVYPKLFKRYDLNEWRFILRELLSFGLSVTKLECDYGFDTYSVNILLEKLLAASSLIYTRGLLGKEEE